uniref:Uncharacterized protein n=1 Tax=Meloidogyne enterolobii TaxID=390850 RepID=A0A6V7TU99_MELEN|nr:unnamed protein product [Meloidogyne enterolobii]
MESKSRFTCSRYHPITDSADPFASSNKNSLSLLTILEYIQSLSDYKLRWELLYKLFLPLPQWRRQELAKLYCEKSNMKECFKKIFNEDEPFGHHKSKLLELLIDDKSKSMAARLYHTMNSGENFRVYIYFFN